MNSGISWRQGGHQVAQKFRMTTLPFQSSVETILPSRSRSTKGGAGSGFTARKRITLDFDAGLASEAREWRRA